MAKRRVIYIRNPSQGSNFRTVGAGSGSPRSPRPPRTGSGGGGSTTTVISRGPGGVVTRVVTADGITYYRDGRLVTAESVLDPHFVSIMASNDGSHEARFRDYQQAVTRPTPPRGPRGPDVPKGPVWAWPAKSDTNLFGGQWNWANLWSEPHFIKSGTGKNQGLTIYTDWGGELPPGFQPGYDPNSPTIEEH